MEKAYQNAAKVIAEVKKAVIGKNKNIDKAFAAILAGGHILIEDVPGVGKTTLAIAFSKAMDLENHRVQFTPDVMPSDILGFSMYQKETGTFSYHEGPIMCHIFLADEINRTSPKTQSALLEVMEEGRVTVDSTSYHVPNPFIVIATQNPTGSAGTQLLPESQLDRFMICMSMGYPDLESEIEIAKGKTSGMKLDEIQKVISAEEFLNLKSSIEEIYMDESIYSYIVQLCNATRNNQYIELGISPRGTIACAKMAKAWAFLQNRNYVIPYDVISVFSDVAKHRIVLNTRSKVSHISQEAILEEIMQKIKQPVSFKGKE